MGKKYRSAKKYIADQLDIVEDILSRQEDHTGIAESYWYCALGSLLTVRGWKLSKKQYHQYQALDKRHDEAWEKIREYRYHGK
jgi:hypothetical protein